MCKIVHVAIQIVNKCIDENFSIDYFKVQKLAYLCQGLHLQNYGVPLAPENILNWSCGAGFKEIYTFFKSCNLINDNITERINKSVDLLSFERDTINHIIDKYGQYSFNELKALIERNGIFHEIDVGEIIPIDLLKDYVRDNPIEI